MWYSTFIFWIVSVRHNIDYVSRSIDALIAMGDSRRNSHYLRLLIFAHQEFHCLPVCRGISPCVVQSNFQNTRSNIPPINLSQMNMPCLCDARIHHRMAALSKTLLEYIIRLSKDFSEKAPFIAMGDQLLKHNTIDHINPFQIAELPRPQFAHPPF